MFNVVMDYKTGQPIAVCDELMVTGIIGEGSRLQTGGLTLLLVSLPADFDDRSLETKIGNNL